MSHITRYAKSLVIAAALLAVILAPTGAALAGGINVGLGYAQEIGLGTTDVRSTIASIINVAMGLLGTIAVVIVLYGGFKWMTSGGDTGKVDEARKLIIAGIIGLVIVLSAYAIAAFVLDTLLEGTGATTG